MKYSTQPVVLKTRCIFVLLLARDFGSGNGTYGFDHVRALLHQRHAVPLYHELRQHDGVRVKSQLKLFFSWVSTRVE